MKNLRYLYYIAKYLREIAIQMQIANQMKDGSKYYDVCMSIANNTMFVPEEIE